MRRALCLLTILSTTLTVPALWSSTASATPQVPSGGRVSLSSSERQGNEDSFVTDYTPDRRFVLVMSEADNLVPGDGNDELDAFVRDTVTGTTTMVSIANNEAKPNDRTVDAAISDDGRFVVFASDATNLVANDTNAARDVFVRDRTAGTTTRVSVTSDEVQGELNANAVDISGNGLRVAFNTASPLVAEDANGEEDVYLRDLVQGTTTRVSVTSSEGEANNTSAGPSLDLDGNVIVFSSDATNLIGANDTNGVSDIYARRLATSDTIRISVGTGGVQATGGSFSGRVNHLGTLVTFQSDADNIVADDGDGHPDVFVRSITTGTLERVSVDAGGGDADARSGAPVLSGNGRFVAFESDASDLVAGDTNGHTSDVFVRDLVTDVTQIMSVRPGFVINGDSDFPSVADTGAVAFESVANNLVPGDTNTVFDAFVAGEVCDGRLVDVDLNKGAGPTSGPDVILGTPGADTVDGLAGNDRFCGGTGNDVFSGGTGNDRAFGGNGTDTLKGQDGNDRLDGAGGQDRLLGGNGNDVANGGAGNDVLEGAGGNDHLNGGGQRDTCRGQAGSSDRSTGCEVRTGFP
jgi:Tol biopolymer transport system component